MKLGNSHRWHGTKIAIEYIMDRVIVECQHGWQYAPTKRNPQRLSHVWNVWVYTDTTEDGKWYKTKSENKVFSHKDRRVCMTHVRELLRDNLTWIAGGSLAVWHGDCRIPVG